MSVPLLIQIQYTTWHEASACLKLWLRQQADISTQLAHLETFSTVYGDEREKKSYMHIYSLNPPRLDYSSFHLNKMGEKAGYTLGPLLVRGVLTTFIGTSPKIDFSGGVK